MAVVAQPVTAGYVPPAHGSDRPSLLRIGTVVWLASELMFFGGLFAAYFGLRAVDHPWPPRDVDLETVRTAIATALLVGSSVTYHRAAIAAEHGDERRTIRWTLLTLGLGLAFLVNQAAEYVAADFTLTSHPYGTMFFLMTGFHGAHVIGGLVLMLVVLGVGAGRGSKAPLGELVTVSEYYWHFVDVVWLAMFVTIYVIQ
jgi:cytochrome c oxidase subunit III